MSKPDYSGAKIVVAMVSLGVPYHCVLCIDTDSSHGTIPFLLFQVGLPARGKSYLSNKLMRYLQVRDLAVEGCLATPLTDIIFPSLSLFLSGSGSSTTSRSSMSVSSDDARRERRPTARPITASRTLTTLTRAQRPSGRSWPRRVWMRSLTGSRGRATSVFTVRSSPFGCSRSTALRGLADTVRSVVRSDATNTTKARRATIAARVAKERGIHLLFLESVCDDPSVIAANIALKVSSGDPDYKDMTREAAEQDFKKRIENYEKVYEPVDEPDLSYCKVVNVGRTVHINRIGGYLESRVAYYLMNLHLKPRAIFLSRVSDRSKFVRCDSPLTSRRRRLFSAFLQHGESMFNVGGQIGGDAELSPRGQQYSKTLPSLILDNVGDAPLQVRNTPTSVLA